MDYENKVLGGFLGAAVGDAMGAATETYSIERIKQQYGGYVRAFYPAPSDVYAAGFPAGSVTDDFSMTLHLAEAIIANGGSVDMSTAEQAITNWYNEGKYTQMIGPTMQKCVARLLGVAAPPSGVEVNPDLNTEIIIDNYASTNGGAMKVLPAGLLHPADRTSAIRDAIVVSEPSHSNSSALAAACAVAAAAAEAMREDATVFSLVEAGLEGARAGHAHAVQNRRLVAVPSVERRIELAVEIALKAGSVEEAMIRINQTIGSGLSAYQSVPAVFGLLVAANGDPMECLFGGVNIGDDTDTVATMVCGLAGVLRGADSFPPDFIKLINRVNGYDLQDLARRFTALLPAQGEVAL